VVKKALLGGADKKAKEMAACSHVGRTSADSSADAAKFAGLNLVRSRQVRYMAEETGKEVLQIEYFMGMQRYFSRLRIRFLMQDELFTEW
jgi:hypothetical protein